MFYDLIVNGIELNWIINIYFDFDFELKGASAPNPSNFDFCGYLFVVNNIIEKKKKEKVSFLMWHLY